MAYPVTRALRASPGGYVALQSVSPGSLAPTWVGATFLPFLLLGLGFKALTIRGPGALCTRSGFLSWAYRPPSETIPRCERQRQTPPGHLGGASLEVFSPSASSRSGQRAKSGRVVQARPPCVFRFSQPPDALLRPEIAGRFQTGSAPGVRPSRALFLAGQVVAVSGTIALLPFRSASFFSWGTPYGPTWVPRAHVRTSVVPPSGGNHSILWLQGLAPSGSPPLRPAG